MDQDELSTEAAIAKWRGSFVGLREEDLDELEAHLRDELDALAEVGLTSEQAFAHASKKIGPSAVLIDEIERAAPSKAWRAPAIALLLGLLVNVLGGAILKTVDWLVFSIGWAAQLGRGWAIAAIVAFVIAAPVIAIAGGYRLAPRIVARVERASAATRIAFVAGMGVFVTLAQLPWLAIVDVNRNAISLWAGWRMFCAPARYAMMYVMPFLVAAAVVVARRRGSRFAFWAFTGVLASSLWSVTWSISSVVAGAIAHWLGGDTLRASMVTGAMLPFVLLVTGFALHSKVMPSRLVRSGAIDLVIAMLAVATVAMPFAETLLIVQSELYRDDIATLLWPHFGLGIIANLALAPLAGAGLLRLRATT